MSGEEKIEEVNYWADDLLDRKRYAEFLTKYVDAKVQAKGPGMVMALDAPWGLGKTFFISRWAAQLRASKHAVVVFDAWQNDSSEDPVISFMAELRAGLTPILDKLPINTAVGVELKEKTSKVVGNLRKATFSAAKVIGVGVVKKLTGVAVKDVVGAFTEEDSDDGRGTTSGEGGNPNQPANEVETQQAVEKGLDDFFEKTLQGHSERLQAVKNFRESLQDLLSSLHEHGLTEGPLYVFIDELDRCRPNYAISLLEGIKHLFSVHGVAFVVSTNLDQLSKAIGAVYGSTFDGSHYLKRFFDFEYELPQPSRINFIKSQIKGTILEKIALYSGLDTRLSSTPTDSVQAFAIVSEAMRLDLRSLSRILTSTEAVVVNLPQGNPVISLWLFFLTAVRYRYQSDFDRIANQSMGMDEFKAFCSKIFTGPKVIQGATFEKDQNGWTSRKSVREHEIAEGLWVYYHATIQPSDWIIKKLQSGNPHEENYPSFLLTTLNDGWNLSRGKPHPLRQYASLISMAGHVG